MNRYYDYCQLRGSSCKAGDPNPCCKDCMFLIGNECQGENCDCGLWMCETAAKEADPTCVNGLRKLEEFAELFGLATPPFIGDPYTKADK